VSSATATPVGIPRRERVRAQTVTEIKAVARQHLVAHGPHGVQLRAVARDLGMTAPALYRYFDSHEALLEALVADLYAELADTIEATTAPSRGDLALRFAGSARAFRQWSVGHRAEFALLFGSPIPGLDVQDDSPACVQSQRFGQAFGALFVELWTSRPTPAQEPLARQLRARLDDYGARLGVPLPAEAIALFLRCWVRLYGAVTMEVFGHLSFALEDAEPLFEREIADLLSELGLDT
jgi:AcrR family transcriptional regulator